MNEREKTKEKERFRSLCLSWIGLLKTFHNTSELSRFLRAKELRLRRMKLPLSTRQHFSLSLARRRKKVNEIK